MPKRHYEVDPRILTVFFFVAIPFLAFGALVVMNLARGHLQNVTGQNLEQRAGEARQLVERYVLGQFSHLHLIALDPQVRAAVNAPPREARPTSCDGSIRPGPPAIPRSSPPWPGRPWPRACGRWARPNPPCASSRWWTRADASSPPRRAADACGTAIRPGSAPSGTPTSAGRPYVVDVVAPPGGAGAMFEIDVPIRDATDRHLLGAVRALYDASDLYSVLASVRVGRTGHAVLMRTTDGLVLAADESSRVLKERFPGFEYIAAARRENRGFWTMPGVRSGEIDEPPRIVGLREPGAGAERGVDGGGRAGPRGGGGPIKSIGWYLFAHVIGVVLITVLLALYFSSQLEAPVIEEALHLHEEHVPSDYRAAS